MSQVSWSFPSFDAQWDDGTNVTEYCHNAVDNDGCFDESDEFEDYDGERHVMLGIPEDPNVGRAGVGLCVGEPPEGQQGVEQGPSKQGPGQG